MANPALNEKTFAPERLRTLDPGRLSGGVVDEGWRERMTLDGVVSRCLVLFPLLLAAGWFGWQAVDRDRFGASAPSWLLLAVLGGFAIALVTSFRPKIARVTGPVYAVAQGLAMGAISAIYEARYEGIVLQAVMLTGAVFALMLGLFAKRVVKVDDKFRRGVILATGAVMIVYVISLVMNLFGARIPYIHDAGPVGILFSLAVVGIAAANLLLDFDLIEKGIQNGAPKWMEWYAAFGLLVTLVWLYLELLRLLSKLRER